MRRLVGLDLNGRYDLAARDWVADGEEDAESTAENTPAPTRLVRGGTAAEVVKTLDDRLIAGPQAELAPHGRGEGWGVRVGDTERRRPLVAAVDDNGIGSQYAEDLRAARFALAHGADSVLAVVPDHPDFDEVAQAGMIAALSAPRSPVRLLWRPVAAFLGLMARDLIDQGAVGNRFRILVHVGAGFEDQILTLRADPDHPGHQAPQRDGPGQLHQGLGLDDLFEGADKLLREANPDLPWNHFRAVRMGPRLVTGEVADGATELLRDSRGSWFLARAPLILADDLGLTSASLPPPADRVAATFLLTPLAPFLAKALAGALTQRLGPVTLAGARCAADGCLRAGRLIERGLPHYFDRLEPIAIAIQRGSEPMFEYLISKDSVIPANREHVSPVLDGFVWGKGKQKMEFYVRKGENEIRHWCAEKDVGPAKDVPVALRIRQTPGQSWARLTISSSAWEALTRSPIALDWETLAPSELSADEVLKKLRPTIPDLIVEKPHLDLWLGSQWAGNGIAAGYARREFRGHTVSAKAWANALRSSKFHPDSPQEKYWLVGTDGSLPADLPEELRQGYGRALARLADEVATYTLGNPPTDNQSLMALTWSFALCPEDVQDRILDALHAYANGVQHPLHSPTGAKTVLRQGAGRAVSGIPRLKRLFEYLLTVANFNNDTINALAMALTRRAEAPEALTRPQIDDFLDRLGEELIGLIRARNFKVRFRNTLSAIAGLFRWRIREPFSLLASQDPVASRLRENLDRAEEILRDGDIPKREQKLHQIAAIIEYLDGQGDPNILRLIESEGDEPD